MKAPMAHMTGNRNAGAQVSEDPHHREGSRHAAVKAPCRLPIAALTIR
jgi:hypothetical protein